MSSQAARRADGEQAAGDSFHMKTNTLKAPARELWVPDEDVYDLDSEFRGPDDGEYALDPEGEDDVVFVESGNYVAKIHGVELSDIAHLELFAAAETGGEPLRVEQALEDGLLHSSEREGLWFCWGLVWRLAAALMRNGRKCRRQSSIYSSLPAAKDLSWHENAAASAAVRQFMSSALRFHGLCVVPRFADRLDIVAALRRTFANRPLQVVVPNLESARKVALQLRSRLHAKVTVGNLPQWDTPIDVHVDAINTHYGPKHEGVTVYLGARTIASERIRTRLRRSTRAICYALLNSPVEKLPPRDRLVAEAFFGSCILDLSEPPPPLPSIAAYWLDRPTYPAGADDRSMLDLKRAAIWHNRSRNQLAAQAASQLRAVGLEALQSLDRSSPTPAADPMELDEPLTVGVLVESSEHAQALQRLLSGWTILDSYEQVDPDLPELLLLEQHIVTLPVAESGNLLADVWIYAAGVGSAMPRTCGPRQILALAPMIVLDIPDDIDQRVVRDVDARRATYRQRIRSW